jgi:hypothetical protein
MDADQLTVAAHIAQGLRLGVDLRGVLTPLYEIPRGRILYLLHGLQDAGVDLGAIGASDELQGYFFSMVEHAAQEANRAKINRWKDAVIHLATDFKEYNFKDNFIRTLDDLTEFDLTVLLMIYTTEFARGRGLEGKVADYFEHCDIGRPLTQQAIKRLASHALLGEQASSAMFGASGQFSYARNELGSIFIRFISPAYPPAPGASEPLTML